MQKTKVNKSLEQHQNLTVITEEYLIKFTTGLWFCTEMPMNTPVDKQLTKLVVALVCSNGEGSVSG